MNPSNLSPEELVREVDNLTRNPTPLETALGNALDAVLQERDELREAEPSCG